MRFQLYMWWCRLCHPGQSNECREVASFDEFDSAPASWHSAEPTLGAVLIGDAQVFQNLLCFRLFYWSGNLSLSLTRWVFSPG